MSLVTCADSCINNDKCSFDSYNWTCFDKCELLDPTQESCEANDKCEIKETQAISEISLNQLGDIRKNIPICKSGYAIDKTWCRNCHWSGGHRHWDRNEVIIFPNNTWCPKSDEILNIYGYNTEIDLTTDWIIVKGHFYNDKSTNTNIIDIRAII